jgi:hypothetical protein
MVVFMVKTAIASIPAFVILAILGSIFFAITGGVFRGLGRYHRYWLIYNQSDIS